jgi:hypothetical protein
MKIKIIIILQQNSRQRMTDEPAPKKVKVTDEITHILVIDVETTGPNVVKNFMPEFGVSFWKIGDQRPLDSRHFSLMQPENTEWDPKTKEEFWDNPLKGVDKKTPPMVNFKQRQLDFPPRSIALAMDQFVLFARLCDVAAKGQMIIVVDTADFDTTEMNYYLAMWTNVPSLTLLFGSYRSVRDIDSFYYGVGGFLKFWGAEEVAQRGIGIVAFPAWVEEFRATHNPKDDAEYIGAKASYVLDTLRTCGSHF